MASRRCQLQRSRCDKIWGFHLSSKSQEPFPYIKAIKKDTPAAFSELKCGDRIQSINDLPTFGRSLKDIQELMALSTYMDILYIRNESSQPSFNQEIIQDDSRDTSTDSSDRAEFSLSSSSSLSSASQLPTAISSFQGSQYRSKSVVDLISDDEENEEEEDEDLDFQSRDELVGRYKQLPATSVPPSLRRPRAVEVIDLVSDDEEDPAPPPPRPTPAVQNHIPSTVSAPSVAGPRAPLATAVSTVPPSSATLPHPPITAPAAAAAVVPSTATSQKRPAPTPDSSPSITSKRARLLPIPASSAVAVKKEPVGFGCADVGDEVVEVENPHLAAIAAARQAVAVIGGDDDGEENVEYVGGTMTVASDMPHPRETCTRHPFRPNSLSNIQHCEQCFCFVCEVKAKECPVWSQHCNATHKQGQWKVLRNSLRSPLLSLLPARRKIAMVSTLQGMFTSGYSPIEVTTAQLDAIRDRFMLRRVHPTSDPVIASPSTVDEIQAALRNQAIGDPYQFLENVIMVVNIAKRSLGKVIGDVAMRTLISAVLLTDCFTVPFAQPNMRAAILEELRPNGPLIQPQYDETLKAIAALTTAAPSSPTLPDWIRSARPGQSKDLPDVGRVTPEVGRVLLSAMEDVFACRPALLEFASRQGGSFVHSVFMMCVQSLDYEVATHALQAMGLDLERGRTDRGQWGVTPLITLIQSKVDVWSTGPSRVPVEIILLRLCFIEVLFLQASLSSKLASAEAAKVLLAVAALQMHKMNRLADDVKLTYSTSRGLDKHSQYGLGVDMSGLENVIMRCENEPWLTSPNTWSEKFRLNSSNPDSSAIIDMTFMLMLKFPAFTKDTVMHVINSSSLSNARHRLAQMKKCIDTIFSSGPTVSPSPFAHSVLAKFLVAHGNLICKIEGLKHESSSVLGCLSIHLTGNFLRTARHAHDFVQRQIEFVTNLPHEVFSLLQRQPTLDPSLFPAVPLVNSASTNNIFYQNLSKVVSGSEMGIVSACLDDFSDGLMIAEILIGIRDWQDIGLCALWARLVRVSVTLLNVQPQFQYPNAVMKEGKHGEKNFHDLWQNLLESLSAINKCLRPDILGNVAANDKWRDLLLAKKLASGLNLPLMHFDIATVGTQLSHSASRALKQSIAGASMSRGFWGFWQRVFCAVAIGSDLLTMIIWENWSVVESHATIASNPNMIALAKNFMLNEDINPLSPEQCDLMWRMILNYHARTPESSLYFLERCCEKTSLLDTIIRHCPPTFVTVLIETRSPALFHYVRNQLSVPSSGAHESPLNPIPESTATALTHIWNQAKEKVGILISSELQVFAESSKRSISDWKDHNMERSLLVSVVIHNHFLVTRLLNAGLHSLEKENVSTGEKYHTAQVILSMMQVAQNAHDMIFVLANVMPWLRATVMEIRHVVDDLRVVGKLGADFMENLKQKLLTQVASAQRLGVTGESKSEITSLLETLALLFPSKETIGNFFGSFSSVSSTVSGGPNVTNILELVKQLQLVGVMSENDHLELCYEYFGMESFQELLFLQFTKRTAVRAPNNFSLLTTAFSLLPGIFESQSTSSGNPRPGQCSAESRRCMSLFLLRWIAACLLENDWEASSSSHLANLRSVLKKELATLITRGLDETNDALASAAGEGFLVIVRNGATDLDKWLLPPPVAYLVISMFANPSMETYVSLRSSNLSSAVKDRLIMSTVEHTALFMAISMKERRYSPMFTALTKHTNDGIMGQILDTMTENFSTSHCWLSSSLMSSCATSQLDSATSASLALCHRSGYLASATQWLVMMTARCGEDVPKKAEKFLKLIHCSDVGEASRQLCTCIAAFRANNVVALVEAIHAILHTTLESIPESLRVVLEKNEEWEPFGVVSTLLAAVASAPWTEREKVVKFVELYVLVTKSPRCAVAGCGCIVSLDHMALVKHSDNILRQFFVNMLSTTRLESEEGRDLLACMRPLLTYVALNPPWAAQSLTTHIMDCLHQPGYIVMVKMYQTEGYARYFERNEWAMLLKLVVGKKIHQAVHLLFTCELASRAIIAVNTGRLSLELSRQDLIEAARCAKLVNDTDQWTAVVLDLLPTASQQDLTEVLHFLFSFSEAELSPAPRGTDVDGSLSDIWGAMFSRLTASLVFSLDLLGSVLVGLPTTTAAQFVRMRPVLAEALSAGLHAEALLRNPSKTLPVWAILLHASPIDATNVVRRVGDHMMRNTATVQRRTAFEKFVVGLKGVYESAELKDRWSAISQILMQTVAGKKKLFEIVQSAKYG